MGKGKSNICWLYTCQPKEEKKTVKWKCDTSVHRICTFIPTTTTNPRKKYTCTLILISKTNYITIYIAFPYMHFISGGNKQDASSLTTKVIYPLNLYTFKTRGKKIVTGKKQVDRGKCWTRTSILCFPLFYSVDTGVSLNVIENCKNSLVEQRILHLIQKDVQ